MQQHTSNPFPFRSITLQQHFDLSLLAIKEPLLDQYVALNDIGLPTIDYRNSSAISLHNKAVMDHYFQVKDFVLPVDVMQPFLGGRINYLNWVYEEQTQLNKEKKAVHLIDYGCGHSAIYLLLANKMFGWTGTGIDNDLSSLKMAQTLIDTNKLPISLSPDLNIQTDNNKFRVIVCNPPYYDTNEQRTTLTTITKQESFTQGGEYAFIVQLFEITRKLGMDLCTSLVGRKSSFENLLTFFSKQQDVKIHTGKLYQGNSVRWVVAWIHC